MPHHDLAEARELVNKADVRFPNESREYRAARDALAVEEIELRRMIERVAEQQRRLPPGGEVPKDYAFEGPEGAVSMSDLFGGHDALIVYSAMYGPERERPCPMCTSFLGTWDHKIADITQRVGFVAIARSPVARLQACRAERGWTQLPFYSDTVGDYTRDYVSADEADIPAFNVFARRDGTIRHFWGGEMGGETADPDQDPRGAPDLDPLWTLLDTTPGGRGSHWYPKLEYGDDA